MKKPVNISLHVNAEALYTANPQPTTQAELDTYVSMSDNNNGGIPSGGTSVNDFTSQVYNGEPVTWDGENNGSDGYRVVINSIDNGSQFFASNPITRQSGQVQGTPIVSSGEDTYTINFEVDAPGDPKEYPPKTYQLDPKLGGNP